MDEKEQYKALMTEIINKQAIILGPEFAIMRARSVSELEISNSGEVIEINGDSKAVLQNLIDTYVELSGQIVKNALGTIFAKYPGVNVGKDDT